LPECFFRALCKEALYQVSSKKHSAKKILGKEASLPSASLPSVFSDTRQKPSLPSVKRKHSAKKISNQILKP